MRTDRLLSAGILFGALTLLPGCFKSEDSLAPDSADVEQEAIEFVALQEEAALADPDVRLWEEPDAQAAPLDTRRWYRQLLDLHKRVAIEIDQPPGEPATAKVTVTCDASGVLHLWTIEGDERVHVEKGFEDTALRSLVLRRERSVIGRHRGWRLVALSGVLIESPRTTRVIRSVRIQAGPVDETITNVTDLVRIHDVLALPPGVEAKITVDTGDASDQVYLHARYRHARMQLESNGDGTFSKGFFTGEEPGPRHLLVDVLSAGTLLDDEAPYDNIAWGIPFHVGRPIDLVRP